MTDDTREALDRAMDALAANAEQDRLIVNPTEDCDSIAEHAQRLARLTQGEAHAHACEIIRLAARLRSSNAVECDNERAIPPLLETTRWGQKAAAAALRGPLSDLTNPLIVGQRREEAETKLADLVAVIPDDILMVGDDLNPRFCHNLHVGTGKRTLLHDAILAHRGASR